MKIGVLCAVMLALLAAVVVPSRAGPATSLQEMLKSKEDAGSIWALLVAGSNSWMNYRHQVSSFALLFRCMRSNSLLRAYSQ